jgi:hypothetical protein
MRGYLAGALAKGLHQGHGDLFPYGLFAAADPPHFTGLNPQKCFNAIYPLIHEFFRMNHNQGRLTPPRNQFHGNHSFAASRGCRQSAEVPNRHRRRRRFLKVFKLAVKGEGNRGQNMAPVLDAVLDGGPLLMVSVTILFPLA